MTAHPYAHRPWLDHYDYWVPAHLNYPKRPLHDILDAAALEVPDHPASSFLGATLTFQEVKDRSTRLAAGLVALGVAKGDRVGIMLPNCPQYLVTTFAVLRCGAVVVNINPSYTAREVQAIALDSGLRVLVTLDRLAPLALGLKGPGAVEHIVITSLEEYASGGAPPPSIDGTLALGKLIASADEFAVVQVSIDADDLAVLQYTGGTTGTPKGAMLSHANLFANVIQTETFMYRQSARGEARYLIVIPYFHIYAFTIGMLMGVWVGALQVILPKYDVDQVLAALRDVRPTYFPGVPTIFVSLLGHARAREHRLDRVRTFNTGGAPCPLEVLEAWERTFGRPLNQGYGLSEASPVTHSTPQLAARRPGTIGLPVCDTDITVVDLDTGDTELPPGQAGELCIAGPQVMKGYWRSPHETSQVLRTHADGRVWLHTGDVARISEDGYTTIVQRKKDMIIVDGFNVCPSEVEAVLQRHPAVRQAAVVAEPDAYHGEVVSAAVVLRDGCSATAIEITDHCRHELAPYKVPARVEFRDAIPMSAVGKVLYRVLREELAATARS